MKIKPAAILLMGPPAAGKGTQAFKLASELGFVHFDTGGEIYRRVTDPYFENDPIVSKQKKVYFDGFLNDPQWVADLVSERVRTYKEMGKGLVFSGSPRTLYEAETVMPILFDAFGKGRVLVVEFGVSLDTARKRSLERISCTNRACRYPTYKKNAGRPCPVCGTPLPSETPKDEEWKVSQLATRFKEYEERTGPAIQYIETLGILHKIDGEVPESRVFAQIKKLVKDYLTGSPKA